MFKISHSILLLVTLFLTPTFLYGETAQSMIVEGSTIPALSIKNKGELFLKQDDFSYSPWSSNSLNGKVTVTQYLGATMKANKINQHFQDAYDAAAINFPLDKHQIITILNLEDAMWGTSGFVTSELKKNKQKYPSSRLVVDKNGIGQQTWKLKKNSYAVIVTDKNSNVLFFKDDRLSETDVQLILNLIKTHL